jgi:TonB family protein
MTRARITLLLIAGLLTLGATLLPAQIINPAMQKYTVKMVPVEYPAEARQRHLEGRGILAGEVDFESGKIISVRMEKSTGHKILDDAALRSFRQWQFKPRLIKQFRTPVTYQMANRT